MAWATFVTCSVAWCCFVLLRGLYYILSDLYAHFGQKSTTPQRLQSYGSWAVVTGCTSGIGAEFCRHLASYGINLILFARRKDALNELANELRNKSNIEVVTDVFDFTSGHEAYERIGQLTEGKDVGILINNVGVMYDKPDEVINIDTSMIERLLHVNCLSAMTMTRLVAPGMCARRKGLVVMLSSGASTYHPSPFMTIYSACKKMNEYFANSLHHELKPYNVSVQTYSPLWIATAMTGYSDLINKPSLISPSAETFGRHAMWCMGMNRNTTGYIVHTMQMWLNSLLWEVTYINFLMPVMKYFRTHAKKSS